MSTVRIVAATASFAVTAFIFQVVVAIGEPEHSQMVAQVQKRSAAAQAPASAVVASLGSSMTSR